MRMLKLVLFTSVATLALTGCKITVDQKGTSLKCSVVASDSVVDPLEPVTLTITASDGVAPYKLSGVIGDFQSSTQITRSYPNATSADITVNDFVVVGDAAGSVAQCSFSLVVHADSGNPVLPSVDVVASPSASVLVGSNITLNATSTGLGASPTFDFAFSQSGVSKVQTGASAVFSVTDAAAHDFDVVVTGSGNSVTATKTIHLTFTVPSSGSMTCTLTHDKSIALVNEEVTFTVTASTAEPITILDFAPGTSGAVVSTVDGVVKVKYSSIGSKSISVRAKAKNRTVACNDNNFMLDGILVREALSCAAFTDDTRYRVYYGPSAPDWDGTMFNSAITWAEIPSGAGASPVSITAVDSIPDVDGTYQAYGNNPLAKEVFFYGAGTFKLELTVADQSGHSAKCQTPSFQVYY